MKVSMRALNWALRFFWIISIAFGITCAYSATLIRVNFSQPFVQASELSVTICLPIVLHNRGYYKLVDLRAATTVFDCQENQISIGTSQISEILPEEYLAFSHNLSISLSAVLARSEYLFNDSSFTIRGSLQSSLASLVPVRFETKITSPWGAPLYGFDVGLPAFVFRNLTHSMMTIPLSFENHSTYFNVTGRMRILAFDDMYRCVGESVVSMDVASNSVYVGEAQMLVDPNLATQTGQIQVFVETEAFNYGPVVSHYG